VSSRDSIEEEASRWLAAHDSGAVTRETGDEFQVWLESDVRHRVAYRRLEATWHRVGRLQELRPLDRRPDADLLRQRRVQRPGLVAAAAGIVLALLGGGYAFYQHEFGWQRFETPIGGFTRLTLDDGTLVDLNTDSALHVRFRDALREVRLMRGEGRFLVARDASRPFVVSVGETRVRAVGTAFSVRLRGSSHVDVLVAEGQVAIASTRVPTTPPLNAGEAAVVLPDRMSVSRVEPTLMKRRLAWTNGRLEFRGETLAEAVAEFNRYNVRQLAIADHSLVGLRVGGVFNATDPESFAAALASAFDLRPEISGSDAIILRPP
jgi:transmembrane sensor